MRAMILDAPGCPLRMAEVAAPSPAPGQVLLRVHACGVCRTDLHIIDGELPDPKLPLILGHQIVGTVIGQGEGATRHAIGDCVGVPWLGWSAGIADIVYQGGRTYATMPVIPGIKSTADMPSNASLMNGTPFPSPRVTLICRPRHCCAPA